MNEWRTRAACRSADPELFFPVGTTGNALMAIDYAKRVCAECAVMQECLEFALATNQDSGVWGGHSEEERRAIRRQLITVRLFLAERYEQFDDRAPRRPGDLEPDGPRVSLRERSHLDPTVELRRDERAHDRQAEPGGILEPESRLDTAPVVDDRQPQLTVGVLELHDH